MSEVRIAELCAGYGEEVVLDGVTLDLASGTLTAVLGPSGCGKSTLLRSLAGLLPARSGSITIDGRLVASAGSHVPPERRRVGLVPQEAALFPHRSVARNIAFGLPRGRGRESRVAELVELVGLQGLEHRLPYELSGGERHRTALARALAPGPDVLLLDEPFSALDAGLRIVLRAQVREVLRAAGTTALLVTHDQTEALSIADKVAIMLDGRVRQTGSPVEVYERPATLAVAEFIGECDVLAGTWRDGRVMCALGQLHAVADGGPLADGTGAAVMVRPEQVRMDAGGRPGAKAVVRDVEYFGHDALVKLQLEDDAALGAVVPGAVVHARMTASGVPLRGARVSLTVRGQAVAFPPDGP